MTDDEALQLRADGEAEDWRTQHLYEQLEALIAQRDELLVAVCRAELELSGGNHSGRGGCDCGKCETLRMLRAVIQKASGQ